MKLSMKSLAALLMMLNGAVMASENVNTPENRQFLKQQENLSRQLREKPDHQLKAWAEKQVLENPLQRSDNHFLDEVVRKQQASQDGKPRQGALYFVSFSIPEEGLKRMLGETRHYGIPATLRGMVNNDLKTTAEAVLSLVKDGATDGVQIDPTLFSQYGTGGADSTMSAQDSMMANLVEEKIEKTAISIRAVLTNYVKAIRYLQGIEHNGEPFTIRDWMRGVREDQKNGWLFISSNADTHASLKPVISMWLSIAIRGLLAMGENRNRRVWFFCDELPTLHKLPDLVEILPEARKFGGCYVFGIQSYAQLEDIYGEKAAATLFDVMNTRAFFRSPSHKIAEFAAGEIGEKEHLKASEQYSYGADPVRDGVSTGKDMERQTLVSYSDIQSLPDLTCYVTLPGP